jgi:hypothetical protein
MTNDDKLIIALQDFKKKYPSITSADMQTFIIGWQEAIKNCIVKGNCDTCKHCKLKFELLPCVRCYDHEMFEPK